MHLLWLPQNGLRFFSFCLLPFLHLLLVFFDTKSVYKYFILLFLFSFSSSHKEMNPHFHKYEQMCLRVFHSATIFSGSVAFVILNLCYAAGLISPRTSYGGSEAAEKTQEVVRVACSPRFHTQVRN